MPQIPPIFVKLRVLCGSLDFALAQTSSRLQADVLCQQLAIILRENGCAFDHVTQFAHVAWPMMLQKHETRFGAEGHAMRAELGQER